MGVTSGAEATWKPLPRAPGGTLPHQHATLFPPIDPPPLPPPLTVLMMSHQNEPLHSPTSRLTKPGRQPQISLMNVSQPFRAAAAQLLIGGLVGHLERFFFSPLNHPLHKVKSKEKKKNLGEVQKQVEKVLENSTQRSRTRSHSIKASSNRVPATVLHTALSV